MKVDFVTLHPDNTATIRKCRTKGNTVLVSRKWKPVFTEGRSVFPLEQKFLFGLIKRRRRFVFAVESAQSCLEFEEGAIKIKGSSWTMPELKDYIAKMTHLSLSAQKPFSNLQVIFLFGMMMFLLILQILVVRRIGI